ncbi:MAG: DUF1232 domain-containing protein [Chloroflexota bacterium]|nr:DUF1232 domain-containing protein [Chloroflexota bacterium]
MTETVSTPGFPRDEFGALIRRLPSYGRLAWALARDTRLSRARRAAVLAGAAYVISPIDLVPGIIPVAGQLDDLLVALAAIRVALDGLRPEVRAERLASVGLSQADLDADLRTTGAIAAWLGRSGLRVGRQLASAAARAGSQIGDGLLEAGRGIRERYRKTS